MFLITINFFFPGLGDAWGAAPPPPHPREATIKELGSHLLQVRIDFNHKNSIRQFDHQKPTLGGRHPGTSPLQRHFY